MSRNARRAVLIDDDERFVRHLSKFVERYCGLTVAAVLPTVEAALNRAGELRADFILVDIVLEGSPGIDALRFLCDAWPDALVLVVSGLPPEYAQEFELRGAHGFLEKKYVFDQLPPLVMADS